MPVGWHDDQTPGRYRAQQSGDTSRFRFAATAQPWKRFLHHEQVLLVTSRRDAERATVEPTAIEPRPLAFVGMRACDLAALDRLDVVLQHDPNYQRRRADLFIVAVSCTKPAATCFCASMGTGPAAGPGADIVLNELDDGDLLAAAHSERGRTLLQSCGITVPAAPARAGRAGELVQACADTQSRGLDPAAVDRAAASPDDAGWAEVAGRCLTCGNCTMVCPTCFCTAVDDRTSLIDDTAQRWQRWDSCFSLDFSYISGGAVRASASSRYRQWYLHKLVTWHDQFGTSGCVGCGRCITWCPTGIDITEAFVQ